MNMTEHNDTAAHWRYTASCYHQMCDRLWASGVKAESGLPVDVLVVQRLKVLELENAELRKDKARLDWLASVDGAILHERWGEYTHYWGKSFNSLRETIDAATKPKENK